MFTKLLKHDIRAVLKYWWIGAVAVLGLSVLGGFSLRIMEAETKYTFAQELFSIGNILALIGIYLLPVFTQIILIIRYYKHFFSDEGYLTFTLPVKKTSLLDSKLLSGFIFMLSSYVVMFIGISVAELIYYSDNIEGFELSMVIEILSLFSLAGPLGGSFSDLGLRGFTVPCIILLVLSVIVYIFLFNVFIYACMTLASSVAQKHKVLSGVGIYVGIRVFLFVLFRTILLSSVFYSYTTDTSVSSLDEGPIVFCVLLGALGVMLSVFGALYHLITVLLNKKLNLV